MSTTFVEVVKIDNIKRHANADRLEVAHIKGTQTIITKGSFVIGQYVIFFPPDILIPPLTAQELGVQNYLKHANYPGMGKCQCRIAACRLRGIPSYGFIIPISPSNGNPDLGANLSNFFSAIKYEPPVNYNPGDTERDSINFPKYTDIENFYRYPTAFARGLPVRVTEKIHGTNCRIGLVKVGDGFDYMAGSHNVRRKRSETCRYWQPLNDPCIIGLLNFLCANKHSVIIYGEIYGQGVQDLDYGSEESFRVFDISVDGRYIGYEYLKTLCDAHKIDMVPVLYVGPYDESLVQEMTYGATTMAIPGRIKSKFKGREGCVITPLVEQYSDVIRGRLILKSVSADYLDRKGGTDNA